MQNSNIPSSNAIQTAVFGEVSGGSWEQRFNHQVKCVATETARTLMGSSFRADMGCFDPSASIALISVPDAVLQSERVKVDLEGIQQGDVAGLEAAASGRLVGYKGENQILQPSSYHSVQLEDAHNLGIGEGQILRIKGSHIRYAGVSEYENWHAVIKVYNALAAASPVTNANDNEDSWRARRFSFSCKWDSKCSGHCADASDSKWADRQLMASHAANPHTHTAWFDSWAETVTRCARAGQQLRFAYLLNV